ncbi:MAG TPA: hypothetical protein EYO59_13080, partial [Chromatiaceae bacterium]|nr:hypothetical protein [Chromatiaceae bacterium]
MTTRNFVLFAFLFTILLCGSGCETLKKVGDTIDGWVGGEKINLKILNQTELAQRIVVFAMKKADYEAGLMNEWATPTSLKKWFSQQNVDEETIRLITVQKERDQYYTKLLQKKEDCLLIA